MAQAYEHLAEWFEYLNDDCDYPKWSQYFIAGLKEFGAGQKGLELGCGSGAFCRLLQRAGYEMSGADLSPHMLSRAEHLAREEGLRIPFYGADAQKFSLPGKYGFVLAPNDVYNYVPPEKLSSAFACAAKCLGAGGLFWFDVSTPYKLCEKVADTVSADDRENVTYLSFNRREGNKILMDVTLFVRRKDGLFERFDETHTQYIHTREALEQALSGAGFELLRMEGHLGEPAEHSDRWNWICRKK